MQFVAAPLQDVFSKWVFVEVLALKVGIIQPLTVHEMVPAYQILHYFQIAG